MVKAGCAALAMFIFGPSLLAQRPCTNAGLSGSYATQPIGLFTGGPLPGPFAATGRILFDGNGNYTGKTTSSFNGQVIPFDANGTYRVNADCSVAVFEPILGLTFEGELVNGNKEFVLVQSNLGSVTLNILRRQDTSGCTLADLDGTYGIQASGLIVTPT